MSFAPCVSLADGRAAGVALQTHHHRGTGMFGGGVAPAPVSC
ncbi:hypothetical protein [Bradyrhizobium sp. BRP56]|nr:hypothetical protein [Bradyrhizobium sp. BRP56]